MNAIQRTDQEIIDCLRNIDQRIRLAISAVRSEDIGQLTLEQMAALRFVYEQPNTTMGEIAKAFHITKASANALIDRLCKKNWLVRKQDKDDRRVVRLAISPPSLKRIRVLVSRKQESMKTMLRALTPKEKRDLLRLLKKLH